MAVRTVEIPLTPHVDLHFTGTGVIAVATCSPANAAAPVGRAPLKITRTVERAIRVAADDPAAGHDQAPPPAQPDDHNAPPAPSPPQGHHDHRHQTWQRSPLNPGETVEPGQFLIVHEAFDLPEGLSGVEWLQRLPATCHAWYGPAGTTVPIGTLFVRTLAHISHVSAQLQPGPHTHTYMLYAVRPGLCALPPPELRTDGVRLPVDVSPSSWLIHVERSGGASN